MKASTLSIIFLIIGIGFAALSVYFALLPGSAWSMKFGSNPMNENAGYGSVAAAIISVGCFISVSLLIRKPPTK